MEELTKMKFNVIKMNVSQWYDRHRCLTMLKVLFRDKVGIGKLAEITNTMDLMNDLVKRSHLTSSDLTILYDTISLTQHYALQKELQKTIPTFPDVREGTISRQFKPHRQQLMNFGMKLTPANVAQIDGLYNTPLKEYTDAWAMITDLENNLKIKEGDMTDFYQSLEVLNLHLALNALKEDIPGTSSALGAPSTSSVLVSARSIPAVAPHFQEAYRIPDLSSLEFNQLLGDVSSWWQHYGNVNMLRVILSEFKEIPLALMENQSQPRSLFQLLKGSGIISQSKVDVIIETVVLGGQSGVETKIKESIPTFPCLSKVVITKFSKHRRNLLEFGKVLGTGNKDRIGYLYNLHVPDLKDQWCLIFKLENGRILTDNIYVKEAFVNKLMDNGMTAEAQALNKY